LTSVEVPAQFQEVLRPHLPYAGAGDFDSDDDLASLGLDSMGVVQLLADLEDHYQVELPDEIVNEETFATVGSLWQVLSTLVDVDRVGGQS